MPEELDRHPNICGIVIHYNGKTEAEESLHTYLPGCGVRVVFVGIRGCGPGDLGGCDRQ